MVPETPLAETEYVLYLALGADLIPGFRLRQETIASAR
jgi:hypothetical protein